eukprot:jgi/Psemu1/38559/gm1.38559_g
MMTSTLQQHQLTMTGPADIHDKKTSRKLQLTRELGHQREERRRHPSKGGAAEFLAWHQKEILEDHYHNRLPISEIHPQKMTGNKDKIELVGRDLSLLVLFIVIHLQALLDEMAVFIYNGGGGLYSQQLISHQLQELHVTQKKVNIEAYNAYSPANMRREYLFCHRWLPLGVVDIPWKHFINVDEFAMEAKILNMSKVWGISF